MNLVKEFRLQIGMSRSHLAKQLNVSYGAVANYELGTRVPNLMICYKIIDLAKKHNIKIELEDIYPRR